MAGPGARLLPGSERSSTVTYFPHDQQIADGVWAGKILEVRQRTAEYVVEGARFGAMPIVTKSPSTNDRNLEKQTPEIMTAATFFSYLGYENVELVTVGMC